MMRTLLIIVVMVALGYVYLNRATFFSDTESEYCAEYRALLEKDEYEISYGERARAVANGCI